MRSKKSEGFTMAEIREATDPAKQYPNEAKFVNGEKRTVNEDNHFKGHDVEVIRKKYLKFTVFMESLNDVLELDRFATVDQFAKRIVDLVHAANQEIEQEKQ